MKQLLAIAVVVGGCVSAASIDDAPPIRDAAPNAVYTLSDAVVFKSAQGRFVAPAGYIVAPGVLLDDRNAWMRLAAKLMAENATLKVLLEQKTVGNGRSGGVDGGHEDLGNDPANGLALDGAGDRVGHGADF